jgi:hypothetical protein
MHTAPKRTATPWRSAKITLAVHPRCGEQVAVWRGHGPGAVWAELSDGSLTILPTAWTDLEPRSATPEAGGKLALEALVQLARWVAARRAAPEGRQEVGHFDKRMQKSLPDGRPADEAGIADAGEGRVAVGERGERGAGAAAVVEQAGPPHAHGRGRPSGRRAR